MFRELKRHPLRRLSAGARALCHGLLGVALIALATFVFLPGANAAAPARAPSAAGARAAG
jgi:hypothetical protein